MKVDKILSVMVLLIFNFNEDTVNKPKQLHNKGFCTINTTKIVFGLLRIQAVSIKIL